MSKFLDALILSKNTEKDKGYIYATSCLFLRGLVIYKGKKTVSVPFPAIILTSAAITFSILIFDILYPDKANWLNNCLDFPMFGISMMCSLVILNYRGRIIALGKEVDSWWDYPFMEEEKEKMKKSAEDWMVVYGQYYITGLYLAYIAFLLPLAKPLIMDVSSEPAMELPVAVWSLLPLSTWWGFYLTYVFELIGLYFSYFIFGRTCVYLMATSINIAHQADLIGIALMSFEKRVRKILECDSTVGKHNLSIKYETYLEIEIVKCVKHYRALQRYSKELATIFAATTNTTYNIGMFGVCVLAVRFATSDENMELVNSCFILIGALAQQFIYSLASELLLERVEKLRITLYGIEWYHMPLRCQKNIHIMQTMLFYMPTLKTVFGTQTSMENLSKEKGKDDLVANTSLLFLYGLKRYKSKSQAAIPIPFIIIVGSTMMCSMVAGGVVNPTKTDWIQLFINLIFIPVSVIVSITIIKNREDIVKNSEKVDDWWKYNFLDEETKEMQDNTAKWMEWYGFYYYSGMYFSCAMNLFPALKRYIVGKSVDPMNNLMYPCWTPLDLETWWGFILTYMFQFTSMYISYFSFGHTCFYLTTAYVSLGNQARLIGLAIMTADERARKVLEEEDSYPDVSKEGRYEMRLKEEITSCIKHYQKMQRCAKNLARIFRPLPILAFDLGMVVVSLSGIRIATETDKLMLVNSFINTGVTLGNQFIMSFVCELLTAEVEKLRDTVYDTKWRSMPVSCQKYIYTFQMMVEHMPTLVTLTGTKINFENFSKVVNASYCYFSLILSMKNNSLYEQK